MNAVRALADVTPLPPHLKEISTMSCAVVVAQVAVEDRTALLHVLAVTTGLTLADALRLLAERPPDTVARVQRLPADLPAVGEVLRLEPEPRRRFRREGEA